MRMARQSARFGTLAEFRHQRDQLRIPIHRLNRTQPQTQQPSALQNSPYECGQRARRVSVLWQIAPPSPKIDARQHQLNSARSDEPFHLAHDRFGIETARRSARLRNYAERAAITAALLNF